MFTPTELDTVRSAHPEPPEPSPQTLDRARQALHRAVEREARPYQTLRPNPARRRHRRRIAAASLILATAAAVVASP